MDEFIENFQSFQDFIKEVKDHPDQYTSQEIAEYFYILELDKAF